MPGPTISPDEPMAVIFESTLYVSLDSYFAVIIFVFASIISKLNSLVFSGSLNPLKSKSKLFGASFSFIMLPDGFSITGAAVAFYVAQKSTFEDTGFFTLNYYCTFSFSFS